MNTYSGATEKFFSGEDLRLRAQPSSGQRWTSSRNLETWHKYDEECSQTPTKMVSTSS